MAHRGKNKAPRTKEGNQEENWFKKRRAKARKQNRVAKEARRRNRK